MITWFHLQRSHRSYHFENFGFICYASRPLRKNQVVKMITWFYPYRLKACWKSGAATRHLILPVTESVGQNGPLKKPDELRAGIRKSLPVSLPGARVQRAQLFAPVIWCCASYATGYYLAQNGGRSSSFAAAFSPSKLLKWKKPPLNLIPKSGKSNQNRFT